MGPFLSIILGLELKFQRLIDYKWKIFPNFKMISCPVSSKQMSWNPVSKEAKTEKVANLVATSLVDDSVKKLYYGG